MPLLLATSRQNGYLFEEVAMFSQRIFQVAKKPDFAVIGILIAIVAILAGAKSVHYLFFHTMAEIFAIVVSLSIFMLTWASNRYLANGYLIVLGAAYGAIGVVDIFHTLTFKGMNLFPGVSTNYPTQFWLTARYLEALALLCGPLFIGKKPNFFSVSAGFAAIAAAACVAVMYQWFPDTFIDGVGLTPFKVYSEYVIITMLLVGFVLLYRLKHHFEPKIFFLLVTSLWLAVAMEFCFTRYAGFYDFTNELGHYFRFLSVALAFIAIVLSGVRQPFELIFREMDEQQSKLDVVNEILTRSNNRYQGILHNMMDAYWRVDANGRIVEANQAISQMLGYPKEALLQMSISDFEVIESKEDTRKHIETIMREGHDVFESQHRCRDGRIIDVEVSANQASDAPGNIDAFHRDITERKQTEVRLIRQAQRAEALLQLPRIAEQVDESAFMQRSLTLAEDLTTSTVSFMHFVNDEEETIELVTWSQRTLAHYCHAGFDQHYPVSSAGIWADAVRQHAPVVCNDYTTYPGKKGLPDGHAQLIRFVSVPVIENGKVVMLTGVGNSAVDYDEFDLESVQLISNETWRIVQRRRDQQALEQQKALLETRVAQRTEDLAAATEKAEAANRAKTIFLANMSHELRTPMNGVLGTIDLALRRATDPKQIDWLGKGKDSAQRMVNVVNDIIDFSKAEAERLPLVEKSFSLSQLIDDAIALQTISAEAKGLHLAREIPGTVPDGLWGDEFHLKQILLNYLGNACKFSDHGTITVRASAVEQDSDSVLARIEVEDQGIGISPEQQAMLFQAFTQVDGSMTRKFGGTGLGLAISKRLAKLMGGDVGLVSQEGRGSTFWVTVRLSLVKAGEKPI
jgi:PAS domain S-box-containing protein